ncbi:ABC transporter substrate-binding protein [Celerinatantimonas sp. YJH-8]|uniref:ABC transporter substrate-binding protein n=1 Tax=Celerinatantimonas sp. YJH-8 TaxID=3228714 RepID=UPI0038C17126
MRYLARLSLLLFGLICAWTAQATQYPLTVTDMAGRQVTIQSEPQHVVLQDGRNVLMLALLDRDNPFKRVVAWNNLLGLSDTGFWSRLLKQWPQASHILDMRYSDSGQINLEEVMTRSPQLMIAELRSKPALEQGGVIKMLDKLHIPVVFVDTSERPIKDAPASVELLGKILNKEAEGKAYADFYAQHLKQVHEGVAHALAKGAQRPSVFIEAHAGVRGGNDCCFTHNHFGWGQLVATAGGNNLGFQLLKGPTGVVAMEKVLQMQPDVYVMTGAQWKGRSKSIALPLGYDVSDSAIQSAFAELLARPGFKQLKASHEHRIFGAYHLFYNHPYNIVAIEALAKDFYPQQFAKLDPKATYQQILSQFTEIKGDTGALTLFAHAKE